MKKKYYYGSHCIDHEDIDAISRALERGIFSQQGSELLSFEQKVAEYCQADYSLAVCNGTAGLHLAALAIGLKQDDLVLTTPLSFVASANAMIYAGAKVEFIDINQDTLNMDHNLLNQNLANRVKNKLQMPKVILPVHFGGAPLPLKEIKDIADNYGCFVIEDACQAMGAKYQNKPIGSSEFSDITVFSLHPVKSISTGEGGLMVTNNINLYEKMKPMRSHGIDKTGAPPWRAEMMQLGYNYRITDFQCVLGMSQLRKLDSFIQKRNKLALIYKESLAELPVKFQNYNSSDMHAYHLFTLTIIPEISEQKKLDIFYKLEEKNIVLGMHYLPIHMHSYYKSHCGDQHCTNSEKYYEQSFSLPIHPGLEESDISYIVNSLKEAFKSTGI